MRARAVPHPPRVLCAAALAAVACGGGAAAPDTPSGEPVIERAVDGGIPVVRNVSGSAWGGTAHLEEELSIGVMEGDDNAMFGSIGDLWLTEDEIYVLDADDASIRVFDRQGRFLRRFGAAGQGPGELELPDQMVVTENGRLLVDDLTKVAVYSTSGTHLADWPLHTAAVRGLVLAPGGVFARLALPFSDPRQSRGRPPIGFQQVGSEGLTGPVRTVPELDARRRTVTFGLPGPVSLPLTVPLTLAGTVSALAPTGDLLYGFPDDRYRFYVQRPDGETFAVERETDPVRIAPGEREEARLRLLRLLRHRDPSITWDGAEIPSVRPYYEILLPDHSGRVWVARQGPSRPVEDCDPPAQRRGAGTWRPCWEPERLLEVFSLRDGAYLGPVARPGNLGLRIPFVRGDHMLAATGDDVAVPQVKLFRIVLPGDGPTT